MFLGLPLILWVAIAYVTWYAADNLWDHVKNEYDMTAEHIREVVTETIRETRRDGAPGTPGAPGQPGGAPGGPLPAGGGWRPSWRDRARGLARGIASTPRFLRRPRVPRTNGFIPDGADPVITAAAAGAGFLRRAGHAAWEGGAAGLRHYRDARRRAKADGQHGPFWPDRPRCESCGAVCHLSALARVGGWMLCVLCRSEQLIAALAEPVSVGPGRAPWDDPAPPDQGPVVGEYADGRPAGWQYVDEMPLLLGTRPMTADLLAQGPTISPAVLAGDEPELAPATVMSAIGGDPMTGTVCPASGFAPRLRGGGSPALSGDSTVTFGQYHDSLAKIHEGLGVLTAAQERELDELAQMDPADEQYRDCTAWMDRVTQLRRQVEQYLAHHERTEGPIAEATEALGGPRGRATSSYHDED